MSLDKLTFKNFGEPKIRIKDLGKLDNPDELAKYESIENFIRENYGTSEMGIDEVIDSGLDTFNIIEITDKDGDTEGIITYEIDEDHEKIKYCRLGIIVSREDLQGEGKGQELLTKSIDTAKAKNCEYITALADTEMGRKFLENNDFYETTDDVTGQEYWRYDL